MRLRANTVKGARDPGFSLCVESVTIAVIRTFIDRLLERELRLGLNGRAPKVSLARRPSEADFPDTVGREARSFTGEVDAAFSTRRPYCHRGVLEWSRTSGTRRAGAR
jgi:hypothetical protein